MDNNFTSFRELIQEQFTGSFATAYDKIDDWTSMQTLIVVSTIDEHFDVLLDHNELKTVHSLEDLFALVLQKIGN